MIDDTVERAATIARECQHVAQRLTDEIDNHDTTTTVQARRVLMSCRDNVQFIANAAWQLARILDGEEMIT